ncbi:MAG TPA: response regulator [Anaeromyxobacteraceae bacterium]|jgi:CheY-like chemotaxis protein|nr:response regulator [Anaeromyxobacteraceae bacterium]
MGEELKLRVLLVEDDADNRELMAEVLESAGCEVPTAASGAAALDVLRGGPVDVVVTDIGMPGMGGLELARAAKGIAPGVPVVVVTGWAEREDIARALGKEIDLVLVKPIDPDGLIGAVKEAMALAAGSGAPRSP